MTRRLVLHIGHAKTGTTTLQKTLTASQSVLLEQGVLYPSTAPHKNNHRFLIPHLIESEDQQKTNPETREARELWQNVVQQIQREAPHTVLLSAEQLFRPWHPVQMNAMIAKLRSVATSIAVIAYIREPAALTLSLLQQGLKWRALPASGLKPPNPRPALEAYQKADFDDLTVRAFDRRMLAGGSVVQDFFANSLPNIDIANLVCPADDNTSISAEAMAVLQDIHSGKLRFQIGKPRREVRRADRQLSGFSSPQLRPEIRDAICASYEHYDWLHENFGVRFQGGEFSNMDLAAARTLLAEVNRVEDFCTVDSGRKSKLWHSLSAPIAMVHRLFRPA